MACIHLISSPALRGRYHHEFLEQTGKPRRRGHTFPKVTQQVSGHGYHHMAPSAIAAVKSNSSARLSGWRVSPPPPPEPCFSAGRREVSILLKAPPLELPSNLWAPPSNLWAPLAYFTPGCCHRMASCSCPWRLSLQDPGLPPPPKPDHRLG